MLTNSRYAISSLPARPRWAFAAAGVAVLFGILTVLSGGRALFGWSEAARAAVGMQWHLYSGLISLLASSTCLAESRLLLWRRWAAQLSTIIAISTFVVFAAFGWHVATGGTADCGSNDITKWFLGRHRSIGMSGAGMHDT